MLLLQLAFVVFPTPNLPLALHYITSSIRSFLSLKTPAPVLDPYSDTVHDHHVEEIRKRVRERDGSDDEGRPQKRARADTGVLLPSEDEEQEVEEPPKPEEDRASYDRERLQQGLRYINGAQKRKIIPRPQDFLQLRKDDYKVALDGEAPGEAYRAVVQALDKVYISTAPVLRPRLPEEHGRLMNYIYSYGV